MDPADVKGGVTKTFFSVPLFSPLLNYKNTVYLFNITFIFDKCHCSWAAMTPVKYERDWKDWRGTFAKPKYHWRKNWRPEFWYPNQKAGKAPGMIELQNHAFRSSDFSKLLKQFVTATFFVPKVSLVVKNLADQRIRRLWRISTQSCFFECKVYKAVHHWGHFSGRWWPFYCHDRTFDPRQIFIQSFNRHRSK